VSARVCLKPGDRATCVRSQSGWLETEGLLKKSLHRPNKCKSINALLALLELFMSNLTDAYFPVLCNHRRWYDAYSRHEHMRRWEGLLIEQPEAAICEAVLREELEKYVDVVFPYEDLSKGGPDFKCYQKTRFGQRHFYVESCCLTIQSVEAATGLPSKPTEKHFHYGLLTERFRAAAKGKASQMADLDAPGLVALGTLHFMASALCFDHRAGEMVLTSEPKITQRLNSVTGDPIGGIYLSTDMKKAAFQRPNPTDSSAMIDGSRSVSGLLLCPFGHAGPYKLHGVLHPNPVRPFDVAMLPGIFFSELLTDSNGVGVTYRWHGHS
jgi:hypothetical protein